MGLTHHALAVSCMHIHAAMASIISALMAVHGENEASVRPITDALNANGFNCDTDVASGAFLGLAQEDLADLHLNIRQKATVRAAQDVKRRRLNEGTAPLGEVNCCHHPCVSVSYAVDSPWLPRACGVLVNVCSWNPAHALRWN